MVFPSHETQGQIALSPIDSLAYCPHAAIVAEAIALLELDHTILNLWTLTPLWPSIDSAAGYFLIRPSEIFRKAVEMARITDISEHSARLNRSQLILISQEDQPGMAGD